MLYQSFKMQFSLMIRRKTVLLTFFALVTLVLINYFHNVYQYRGLDVIELFHPMRILSIAPHNYPGFYFRQYFPLLIVIPAAFAYLIDGRTNTMMFIQTRVGRRNYYFGHLISVFLVTFLGCVFKIFLAHFLQIFCSVYVDHQLNMFDIRLFLSLQNRKFV